VLTNTPVTEVTADAMLLKSGERIPADLRVWAAGVKAAPLASDADGLARAPSGQFVVRPTLQTETTTASSRSATAPGAFCRERRGPCRRARNRRTRWRLPPIADLVAIEAGRPLRPFVYHDHGSLVSLSRFSTVGSLMGNLVGGRMAIEGRLARFVYTSLYTGCTCSPSMAGSRAGH
jgi:NADH dehydrogenase